ncbi:MAG TPA: transporter associated domain-containing protein [Candidatus Acidoferrales bacterium]|nr:transporter associated domain-containing protein [Candidatus Acidoferrales bacterium]
MKKYDAAPPVPALIVIGVALIAWVVYDHADYPQYWQIKASQQGAGMLILAAAIIWRKMARARVPPGGSIVVKGSLKMDDLEDLHDIQLPMDPCYTTVGGFLLEQLKREPRVGESADFGGFRFTVAAVDRTAISRVRIQELTGREHVDATAELIRRCENASPEELQNGRLRE